MNAAEQPAAENTERKVLIVDDEPHILSAIRDLLEEDFSVLAVTDAQMALPGAASGGITALIFYLGQECYAIELTELAEVFPFAACAPLPGAPQNCWAWSTGAANCGP